MRHSSDKYATGPKDTTMEQQSFQYRLEVKLGTIGQSKHDHAWDAESVTYACETQSLRSGTGVSLFTCRRLISRGCTGSQARRAPNGGSCCIR